MAEDVKCACPSIDAYFCWMARYPNCFDRDDVVNQGGPCECCCHDDDEDYDDWTYEDGVLQR